MCGPNSTLHRIRFLFPVRDENRREKRQKPETASVSEIFFTQGYDNVRSRSLAVCQPTHSTRSSWIPWATTISHAMRQVVSAWVALPGSSCRASRTAEGERQQRGVVRVTVRRTNSPSRTAMTPGCSYRSGVHLCGEPEHRVLNPVNSNPSHN